MTDDDVLTVLKESEHQWVKNDQGEMDTAAYESNGDDVVYHVGVRCQNCGYTVCFWCIQYGWEDLDMDCNG